MNDYMIKLILRGVKSKPKKQIIGRYCVCPYQYLNIKVVFEAKISLEENLNDIIKELNNLNSTRYNLKNNIYKYIYLDKIIFNKDITIKEVMGNNKDKMIILDTYMFFTLLKGYCAKIIISRM
jgi:hypothetical protein